MTTRPHQDLGTRTLSDREAPGQAIVFAAGSSVAIIAGRSPANRGSSAVATYEALIREARASDSRAKASVVLLSADDGSQSFALYRFQHRAELAMFRATPRAIDVLGAERHGDGRFFGAQPIRTFA